MKFLKRRVGQNPRWLIYYQYYQLKINSKKVNHVFFVKMKFIKKLIVSKKKINNQPLSLMHKTFVNGGILFYSFLS
jgi:hypothetical protein